MNRPLVFQFARGALALLSASCGPAIGPGRTPESAAIGGGAVVDRLFFGRAIPGGGTVAEDDWAAFLDEEVSPRFPEGLTAWRAEGRWTDPHGRLIRESVFVAELLHPEGPGADDALEQIAREYRRRFRQQAVLRATTPARLRLYEGGPPPAPRPSPGAIPSRGFVRRDPALPDRPAGRRVRPGRRTKPVVT